MLANLKFKNIRVSASFPKKYVSVPSKNCDVDGCGRVIVRSIRAVGPKHNEIVISAIQHR